MRYFASIKSGWSASAGLRLLRAFALGASAGVTVGERARISRKYCPVKLRSSAATVSGVPCATTSPPFTPPPGPRSSTQSAVLMPFDTRLRRCSVATQDERLQAVSRWRIEDADPRFDLGAAIAFAPLRSSIGLR